MILGIDYGLKNIGLAVSEGLIAEPYGTLAVSSQQSVVSRIGDEVQKLGIDKIIVGISEGKSGARAQAFGNKLAAMLRLPVEFVDETLSTQEAHSKIQDSRFKIKDKNLEHARAAAVILQRYLDNV